MNVKAMSTSDLAALYEERRVKNDPADAELLTDIALEIAARLYHELHS